jgi:hypothetical protein
MVVATFFMVVALSSWLSSVARHLSIARQHLGRRGARAPNSLQDKNGARC